MNKLKVICEMGQADKRALLVELPRDVVAGLSIAADGTVDTKTFLELLARHYYQDDEPGLNSENLMELIFRK